jgi:hypothetical protein
MALQSDSQGFLIGEPVDIGKAVNQLKQIRTDVHDIKRALLGAPNSGGNGSKNTAIDQSAKIATPSSPRNRDSKTTGKAATPVRSDSGTGTQSAALTLVKGAVTANGRAKTAIVATPKGRDAASGRFAKKDKSESGDDENKLSNDEERKSQKILSNLAGRIATTAIGATAGAEEVDPTIKAFQEVAEPMQRGYQSLFGGGDKDKKERWYKKLFKELNLFRKDETAFNKAQAKVLKNIEAKPAGGDSDSSGTMLMMTGLLGRLGPMLLTGITAVLGFIFSPIGLAIGAAATIAWGLFTESGQKFFGEVGAKILVGWDTVVTAFAPVTESISKGWDTVKGGFDSLINGMVSTWDAFTGFLKDKFGIDIPAIFKPVVDVSKKAVEAAKETVNAGTDMAKNTASKALEAVEKSSPKTTEALGNVWNKAKNGAQNIADHATGRDKGLGYISSRYEGNIGSAHKDNIGSAYGKYQFNTEGGLPKFLEDNPQYAAQLAEGGAPGSAGFNKKWEQIAKDDPSGFLAAQEASGRKQYYDPAIKKAGSLGFNTEDRGIQEAMFSGAVQHGGWNSKVLPRIAENYDLKSMSAPEQLKAIYSERRKYASENLKGSDLKNVLARYDNEESNTVDLSKSTKNDTSAVVPPQPSISDDPTQGGHYKYETLEGGKVQVTDNQTGVMELASDEQANAYRKQQGKPYLDKVAAINAGNMPLYHSLAVGLGGASQTQTAFAAAPKVPTFTPAPVPAEAPPQITPLASLNSGRNVTVTMPAPDVGQDVKDRGVAHIVTGGYSSRG